MRTTRCWPRWTRGLVDSTRRAASTSTARFEHGSRGAARRASASVGALVPLGTVNMRKMVRRAGVNPPPGGQPTTPEQGQAFGTPWNAIGAAYFDTMGIALARRAGLCERRDVREGIASRRDRGRHAGAHSLAERRCPRSAAAMGAGRQRIPGRAADRSRRDRRGDAARALRNRAARRRLRAAGTGLHEQRLLSRAARRRVRHARRCGSARDPDGGAGLTALQRPHLQGARGQLAGILGADDVFVDVRVFRRPRDGGRPGRHLRRDVLRRGAAHAGNRRADGDWRRAAQRAVA